MVPNRSDQLDRAHGALAGLALGDALGMPTQSFPRADVVKRFGVLSGLCDAPADQPVAPGMPAGRVTDDTEQALLLARRLLADGGVVDPGRWALDLLAWEQDMAARGSRDLLGPSTSRAVSAIRDGAAPADAGSTGTTNGAAMRICPVGIATPWGPGAVGAEAFLGRVERVCLPTHHTGLAISGAAAVGAAVSVGVSGGSLEAVMSAAVSAAEAGASRGRVVAGPSVARRIDWAVRSVASLAPEEADDWVYEVVGTTVATQESVPAAFALLPSALRDPWLALRRAASLGGDTDTVAAMVGAMAGAVLGRAGLPSECDTVERRNRLELRMLAAQLLELRAA